MACGLCVCVRCGAAVVRTRRELKYVSLEYDGDGEGGGGGAGRDGCVDEEVGGRVEV
jgi:hypothetical protein